MIRIFVPRVVVLFLLGLTACPYRGHRIPRDVHSIAPLNSEYDDINMAAPPQLDQFVWSTNRGTNGGTFDLWTASGTFFDGGLALKEDGQPHPFEPSASPADEFGPTWVVHGKASESRWSEDAYVVFSSNRMGGRGGLDLYRVDPRTGRIDALDKLNGPRNDAYWTRTRTSEFFVSDRAGHGLDLFEVVRHADGRVEIVRLDELCTNSDETALSATHGKGGHTALLFASNREGGHGGWDLYYAVRKNNKWSKPRNLGARFNTEHNEFRPVASWGAILFSSDRPGGKGGYDLYRARAPQLK